MSENRYYRLLLNPFHLLSLGFGSGLAPKAPGTFGTAAAIPLCWLLQQAGLSVYGIVTVVACIAGIWLCGYTARAMGEDDHPAIVWDEIAGFMIAMFAVPFTWYNLLIAFVLFRFFDVVKPGPIGWCDRNLHGGFGIMADDLIAGLASALLLHGGYSVINLLG
ncbi:phosphatidylglycerophosphatase A [Pseudidiomarina sp.]|uniref:phosphatidylglycerophosphatase A family protein n=1 Tax=Pseudidiomarina sp. TaxID=2081707 RepID=UPI00299CF60B|nr:phosphatidylglycerophosphatase A [Pseudidiomarina sp.]MDX1705608.1 phosphatidylglycerophosphatase A [Pseudidiomarina sp.]